MLLLGFGKSIGACIIADDVVIPIEIGMIKFSKKERLMDRLSKETMKADDLKLWLEAVYQAVDLWRDVLHPDRSTWKIVRRESLG